MKKIIAMITLICVFTVGFTFGVSAEEVLCSVDTTTECKFQLRTSWVDDSALNYIDETDGASHVGYHRLYSYCTEDFTNWKFGNAIAITLKNAASVVVTGTAVSDSNNITADNTIFSGTAIGTADSYTRVVVPYTPAADDNNNVRIWVQAYGHDCVYIKSIELVGPSRENLELVSSTIADNAINVEIDKDLELAFNYTVDIDNVNLSNIAVNGSFDMIKNSSVSDGVIDGITSDTTGKVLTIDFKDFEYGKRYTIELINIPFTDTTEKYSGKIKFTTAVPSGVTKVVKAVDTTSECKFQLRADWVGETVVATLDETESANCITSHNHYSYCTEDFSGWTSGNAIEVVLKNAATVVVTSTSVTDSNYILNDATLMMLNQNAIGKTTEYTKITIPYTPGESDSDNIRIWVKPYGHDKVYIKSLKIVNRPENIVFTNEKVTVDCTKGLNFGGYNTSNAGGAYYDEAEAANRLVNNMNVLLSDIENYKNIEKIVVKMKPDTAAGFGTSTIYRISKATVTAANQTTADNLYANGTITLNEEGYTDVEIYPTHSDNDGDTARLWIYEGNFVKSVEFIPYGYTEDDYYIGDYAIYRDYGKDNEENVVDAGLAGGDYSAVLSGLGNISGEEKTITVINALYVSGKLARVDINSETLDANETLSAPLVATLEDVPAYEEGMELKSFILDNNMRPVTKAISITKNKKIKVLIVGNSITRHQPGVVGNVNWEGNWGMAATAEKNDYVHRLMAMTENAGYTADFMISNPSGFEKLTVESPTELPEYLEFNPDIVIATLGANCGDSTTFAEKYIEFVEAVGAEKNIIGSTLWCGAEFWKKTTELAEANNYNIVHCNEDDPTGQTHFHSWSGMSTFGDNGVGWHPGDVGMKEYADEIWAGALEEALEEIAITKASL